jgi:hypothetical protein
MSRHCFYWIHLSLVIDLLFGGKWVFIHNPCGFFFKRDQGLSLARLTVNCALGVPASVQF